MIIFTHESFRTLQTFDNGFKLLSDTEERVSIAEDEIVHTKHEKAQPTDVLAKVEVFGVTAELGVAVSKEQGISACIPQHGYGIIPRM